MSGGTVNQTADGPHAPNKRGIEDLFEYQREAVDFLFIAPFRLLSLDMGLGKTPISLVAAEQLQLKKILVICPAAARINWLREINRWTRYKGAAVFSVHPLAFEGEIQAEVIVVSYNFLVTHILELVKTAWDLVIFDEVHLVKSTDAERSKAAFGKKGVVRNAKRVWCLSGTPISKSVADLWIMLYSFSVTTLGYDAFVQRYCETYEFDGKTVIKGTKDIAIPEIRTMLAQFTLRREQKDVLKDLPPLSFETVVLEAGTPPLAEDTSLFVFAEGTRKQELEQKLALERKILEDIIAGKGAHPDLVLALQSVAKSVPTLRRYVGLQKIEPIAELVSRELDAGAYKKIVIFAVHRDVVELLRQRLKNYGAVAVYGGSDPKKVQKRIDDFQNNDQCKVFIGNYQAAGSSLTLTASNQVLLAEPDYNPTNILQAPKRCHRFGQTLPVFVRAVSINDPIDEQVNRIFLGKVETFQKIFET